VTISPSTLLGNPLEVIVGSFTVAVVFCPLLLVSKAFEDVPTTTTVEAVVACRSTTFPMAVVVIAATSLELGDTSSIDLGVIWTVETMTDDDVKDACVLLETPGMVDDIGS
jgi:hypothetical protein